jgi:hypothetical protein
MSAHICFIPGTAGNLEAFLEAVDEAIVKHGYDKKTMRNWLGSNSYRQYLHMKANEAYISTSGHQIMGSNLATKDEVTAERDERKEGKGPARGSVQQHQSTQRAATQAASANSPANEDVPSSDSSRIATLADVERFKADFEQRLKKLEEHAFGHPPPTYSA